MKTNTLENKMDSALIVLDEEESEWAKQKKIEIQYLTGNFEDAGATLLSLSNNPDNTDFIGLYSLLVNVASENRSILDLTSDETETLTALAGKQSSSGVAAENILTFITGEEYPEVFDTEIEDEPERNVEFSKRRIYVYPNPANNLLNIDLTYYHSDAVCKIAFYDLAGKKVSEYQLSTGTSNTLNLATFSNGIYFMSIISDGIPIVSDKIVKQ